MKWTHDAVLEGLDWISTQPTNKDVAMVFLSGQSRGRAGRRS
jgi:hypothetical protein